MPLESDPSVFNRYAKSLGCERVGEEGGVNFCDVFGLDVELLGMVPRPVLAVILLFPIEKDQAKKDAEAAAASQAIASKGSDGNGSGEGVFYIKQKIGNACGTIALLHAIANNDDLIALREDSFLSNFVRECKSMSPDEKADYLDEKADFGLESAHHAAAMDETSNQISEEDLNTDLHFVCYVEKGGLLWELDGRRTCKALSLSKCTKEELLEKSAQAIQKRMQSSGSLRFNIMACTLG